jgi:RHS repeat-associated protein
VYLQNNQPGVVERSRNDTTESYTDVFIYEGAKRIARVRIDDTGNTKTETFINNYQGSPVVVLSSTGNIQYQKYLDPFGNMEMEIGVPSSDIEFQYTDKEYDERLGLYYFQARYYDGVIFLGRDRVHLEDNPMNYFGINPYLFANNNPVTNSDPDGNKNKKAVTYANDNLMGKKYGSTTMLSFPTDARAVQEMVCNEFVSTAYVGSGAKDFPYYQYTAESGDKYGSARGSKYGDWQGSMQAWFKDHGNYYSGDQIGNVKLAQGDVLFMGKGNDISHVAMIHDVKKDGSFSVSGAHSKGTGVLQENGQDKYFTSQENFITWFTQGGNDDKEILGIGQKSSFFGLF